MTSFRFFSDFRVGRMLSFALLLTFAVGSFAIFSSNAIGKITTDASIQQHEGKTVRKISVSGNKRIELDAIIKKIQTKEGATLNRKTIRSDIKAIFAMGYFNDIEVEANTIGSREVDLEFKIRERPVIAELIFEGNEQIETEDLQDVVQTKEWSILDINRVREDVEKLQKHYADKGFYLAKVKFEINQFEDKEDEVSLTFKINDYDKVRIKKITFLNNKVFSDDALRNVFQETREGGVFSFLTGSGNFKESGFKQDLQRLTYWYLDHGYIKFRYENPVVTISDDKKYLYISIYVEEGEQYSIGEIDFSGDLLFSKEKLREDLKLLEEDTFRISLRNADILHLTEKYQDLGYAFVNVIPKMDINDETRIVNINYYFEKGHLVYIGEINVVGNSKTHDKVIRRELRVYEGELYNGTRFRKSKERVERLGYFEPGSVVFNTITPKGKEDILDIEISVKERSTGTITVGAGYGSVQKFFLTTQVSEINLLGRGQTLSFQAQYAADRLQRSFNLGFTDPYAFDTRWSMGFDLFSVQFRIPRKYLMRKLGFDVRFGHPLTDDINLFITYKNEGLSVVFKDDEAVDSSLDEGVLSSVIWSVVRDKRNNRFEPTGGNFQRVSLETAGLGGDKKFLKWNVNNRFYSNFIGNFVLRNSTQYGQISKITERDVPPSEKFFLGGPNNMKGFNIFSLGPQKLNSNNFLEPVGGIVELFSLFEIEHPLIREAGLKWVVFFDIGNSFEHFPGINGQPFTLRKDVGFGVRWFSPIGPLRFEWGFPLDKKPNEESPVFAFFIGPPF